MKNQHVSANKYNDQSVGNIKLYPRAKDFSLLQCHCCGLLNPQQNVDGDDQHCSRCHTALHLRKPYSLDRTLALVIAASILYIPANVLPMTMTDSLLGRQQDTIMSGVIYFWKSGDYLVSAVIFMASIFIPMLKLLILCFLLIAVRIQSFSRWNFSPEQCTLLYRVVEFIGRWSMVDDRCICSGFINCAHSDSIACDHFSWTRCCCIWSSCCSHYVCIFEF